MRKKALLVRFFASALLLASSFCPALAQQPQGSTRSSDGGWAVVKGSVKTPARVKLSRPVRLVEILAVVGGVRGNIEGDILIAHADGTSATYRLKDIKRGGNKSNPYIQAGDTITVAE